MLISNSILPLTHDIFSSTVTSTQTITSTATLVEGTTTVAYGTRTVTSGITTIVVSTVTVTGGVATVTLATSTVSLPLPGSTTAKKRDINGASIPAYASPCSGVVRYSSACSCLGVTATTVTAPASTVTVTATKTLTVTTAILATSSVLVTSPVLATSVVIATFTAPVSTVTYCANALPTFAFQSTGLSATSKFAVLYGNTVDRPANASVAEVALTSLTLSGASIFSLNAAGNLLAGQLIGNVDFSYGSPATGYLSPLYFTGPDIVNEYGYTAVVCQISATNQLTCSAGHSSFLLGCGSPVVSVSLGTEVLGGCAASPFTIVPVCVVPGAPPVPATSTVPTTSTAPASTATACATFIIEDTFFGGVPYYGLLTAINSTAEYVLFESSTLISQASVFSVDAAGRLLSGGLVAVADPTTNLINVLYFVSPDTIAQSGFAEVTCQTSVSNQLSCTLVNGYYPVLFLEGCGTSGQSLSFGGYVPHGCFGSGPFPIVCTP